MSNIGSVGTALAAARPSSVSTPSVVAAASLAFDEAAARAAHAAAAKASTQFAADTIRTDEKAVTTADAKALEADAKVKADEKSGGTINLTA